MSKHDLRFLCYECPEVPVKFPDMFILMDPIGFLEIISLKSKFTADFLAIKIGCKKQDGRPEAGVFHHGSQIRSTDSYERPKPVDYDASKKLVL